MAADKHFDQTGVVPEALEDHQPDDMPAARAIGVVVIVLLVVCTIITAIMFSKTGTAKDLAPTEQTSPTR